MLAPRKKLWSTPPSAVRQAIDWIRLQPNDVVCDIGCGDGRVIIQWAEAYCSRQQQNHNDNTNNGHEAGKENQSVKFLGLDINPDRINEANAALCEARSRGRIPDNFPVQFECANALDSPELIQNVTIFFLYLVPRGLRLIKPVLLQVMEERNNIHETESNEVLLRVVTYMSPLPGESNIKREQCEVDHQPGAKWPLYLYELTTKSLQQQQQQQQQVEQLPTVNSNDNA